MNNNESFYIETNKLKYFIKPWYKDVFKKEEFESTLDKIIYEIKEKKIRSTFKKSEISSTSELHIESLNHLHILMIWSNGQWVYTKLSKK